MDALLQLPNEILENILLHLPALVHSRTSIRTICNFGLGNSRFLAVSRLSSVWKSHYESRWLRCDRNREEERRRQTDNNFWKMYGLRSNIDSEGIRLLEGIIFNPENRKALSLDLVKFGYDLWDALAAKLLQVEYPAQETQTDTDDTPDIKDVPIAGLTRGYWAREVLGVLARVRAVDIWLSVGQEVSFEQGLACLSSFFGEDIEKIFDEFNILAQSCKTFLLEHHITDESNMEDVAILICSWMRSRGFVKTDMVHYYNFTNHFPHHVLFVQPMTLPISLVYIFVSVARRLGYDAHPVAFPHKVLSVIFHRSGDPVYVDVFESATRPILSYTTDLPHILQSLGIDPLGLAQYASPASTATMILRAARNIINSLERVMVWSEADQIPALYAAYCAALLVTGDAQLIQPMLMGVGPGPLDGEIVMRNAIRPNIPLAAREEMDIYLQRQAEREKAEPRLKGRSTVKYLVGTVFKHKAYNYIGLIRSWDYLCEATNEWISRMRVDDLLRGRNQPFYHSYTTDGYIKYVAEENIEPLPNPSLKDMGIFIRNNKDLGRWFDGVNISPSGSIKFIPSPETRMLYPDDDSPEGRTLSS